MDEHNLLRQTVATFLGVDPQQVHADLSFAETRVHGSLARARLYAAIQQRLGRQCQGVFTARTYEELHAAMFGTPAVVPHTAQLVPEQTAAASSVLSEPQNLFSDLACGIDIEIVEELPVVQDYWEDPFYTMTFTAAEIAYCLMQATPAIHFAARWCAKEALKKCDQAYSQVAMNRLEVAFTTMGAPCLRYAANGAWERLPVALSLSHTSHMAAAVVVKQSGPSLISHGEPTPTGGLPPTVPVSSVSISPASTAARLYTHWLPTLLGVCALGLALWAFVRTW
jgi:holo-[acyl-carrier protein] synthase